MNGEKISLCPRVLDHEPLEPGAIHGDGPVGSREGRRLRGRSGRRGDDGDRSKGRGRGRESDGQGGGCDRGPELGEPPMPALLRVGQRRCRCRCLAAAVSALGVVRRRRERETRGGGGVGMRLAGVDARGGDD